MGTKYPLVRFRTNGWDTEVSVTSSEGETRTALVHQITLPDGLHQVAPRDALVIDHGDDGAWAEWAVQRTLVAWHGAGWWDQATPEARRGGVVAVWSWFDALGAALGLES